MLGVDDVDFSFLDENFSEGGLVLDVLVGIPGDNEVRDNAPVDDVGNYPDGLLVKLSPDIIVLTTG